MLTVSFPDLPIDQVKAQYPGSFPDVLVDRFATARDMWQNNEFPSLAITLLGHSTGTDADVLIRQLVITMADMLGGCLRNDSCDLLKYVQALKKHQQRQLSRTELNRVFQSFSARKTWAVQEKGRYEQQEDRTGDPYDVPMIQAKKRIYAIEAIDALYTVALIPTFRGCIKAAYSVVLQGAMDYIIDEVNRGSTTRRARHKKASLNLSNRIRAGFDINWL